MGASGSLKIALGVTAKLLTVTPGHETLTADGTNCACAVFSLIATIAPGLNRTDDTCPPLFPSVSVCTFENATETVLFPATSLTGLIGGSIFPMRYTG